MDQGDVVIARDNISEGRQFFLYSYNFDIFWQTVSNVSQLVVCCIVWDQKTFLISFDKLKYTCSGSTNNSGTSDSCLYDWNEWSELRLEYTVKVVRSTCSN